MILSDKDILHMLEKEQLTISPLNDIERQVQPASVDLRLSTEFYQFEENPNVKIEPSGTKPSDVGEQLNHPDGGDLELKPRDFVLGSTVESIDLPDNICGILFGRSGLGRLGVVPYVGAGFVNPGWEGKLTLELVNHGPHTVVLEPGKTYIIQIAFVNLTSPVEVPYGDQPNGKYQGQRTVSRSLLLQPGQGDSGPT
jgi:dCTP deaminase